MKKYIVSILLLTLFVAACNTKDETKTDGTKTSSVKLPYEAEYTADFTTNVSDSDLLTVLNSYKYWETGDLKGLRSTMADTISVQGADGFRFTGPTDSLMKTWGAYRNDSLSSVKITMEVWLKNHANKDSADFVNVWYKEIDTYKSGKVDSANYEDDNAVKNGKIVWFSSHRQLLAKEKK
ncbi:MAG: hypothetical protein JWO92_1728 [Chitinophagaceae bacterium]|nr:hypothetical protein [Chitinophagaceae bacterium]MDB5222139.1 hypothetical protein [Chitinophagaceae bacterium]